MQNMELQFKLQKEVDMFWLNQGSKDYRDRGFQRY